MENSVVISNVYRECPIVVGDKICKVNLLPMEMHNLPQLIVKEKGWYLGMQINQNLYIKGCDGYLAFVKDTSKDEPRIEDYPVVREYEDVFPDELPGLPPYREVEFTIKLVPGAEPISNVPYRMAPLELQELKEKWQELLDRAFIRPMTFFGHIVSSRDIELDHAKVEAITNWSRPSNVTEVRSFMGLVGYYRRFVEGFSSIAFPLTQLTRKGVKFEWNEDREQSFQDLKKRLVSAPILVLPSGSGGFQVYSDASKRGLGRVLMQHVKVISYASRQLKPYEDLNMRQRMWLELFKDYDANIQYHPVKANIVVGALSRKNLGNVASLITQPHLNSYLERLNVELYVRGSEGSITSLKVESNLITRVKETQKNDTDSTIREEILKEAHNSLFSIHPGSTKIVIKGPELVRITNEKVEKVKESLKEARSRQKSYADQHRKFGEFERGDHVFLKVSPCKGVKHFGMKRKLSLRYVGPFDVMEKVGEVSYRVLLPP
ncbi:uncharacterized protein LOC141685294 [Apium graveolens]|uniref:uncharacterized protein LOC141685294 n=1 Tax=Apium graveolens TaxID=4045 RepID=UPI003D7B766B